MSRGTERATRWGGVSGAGTSRGIWPRARAGAAIVLVCAAGLAIVPEPAAWGVMMAPATDSTASAESAQLEQYLESRGLSALLAEHLQQRLSRALPEDRGVILERLGKLYVDLLSSATTEKERSDWQERARELIKLFPDVQTSDLRLNLLRADYAQAEELSEKWRLALAGEDQRADAERKMRALRADLEKLSQEVGRRLETLERSDGSGRDPAKLQEDIFVARRLRAMSQYYAGWAAYYHGMLLTSGGGGSTGGAGDTAALDAVRSFSVVLGRTGSKDELSPERMAKRSFKHEESARAALGLSLSLALQGRTEEALRWLEAVENEEELSPTVRESLLSRRAVVLAGAGRWRDLAGAVDRARKVTGEHGTEKGEKNGAVQPLTTFTARLIAVLALRAQPDQSDARVVAILAQTALGDLVSRQEIAHVLDLAKQFGTAPLGDQGFIVHYVRGVQAYENAIAAHKASGADTEEPASDPALINAYSKAAELLDLAPRQSDAATFAAAGVRAAALSGRALFHAGRFGEAADRFVAASKLAEGIKDFGLAEEHLWLAIVALDRGARALTVDAAGLGARADELTALFLKSYPRSNRSAGLVLRRSESTSVSDEQAVAVLLTVPKDDPVYEASRRQIVRLMYRQFRSAGSSERPYAASRLAPIAEEVIALEKRLALGKDAKAASDATQRLITVTRQLLDALLSVPTPDVARAKAVLNDLKAVVDFNSAALQGVEDELAYRRMQIALASGDVGEAESLAEKLNAWTGSGAEAKASRFASAAQRALYLRAAERYRALPARDWSAPAPPARVELARQALKYGQRVLEQFGALPDANDPAVATLMGVVAAAALDVASENPNDEMLKLAVKLDTLVTTAQPTNAEALRRLALSAELTGDRQKALDLWRTLSSGYEAGSPAFFEAKYNTIRLLEMASRLAAAKAMAQHAVLYPEYGPEPWGSKLKQLHEKLRDVDLQPAGNNGGGGAPVKEGVY
ncbi:MAG: hypothetical protein IBJ18_00380 [Phycisphaerales bacterium]|nr:hypothetical protein [Phycisphaerales bacterium]